MGSSGAVRSAIARQTFAEFGVERLLALCAATGAGDQSEILCSTFRTLIEPWGKERIGERPRCPSSIADDEAPYEFSIAFSGDGSEVQVYVEPRGEPPSLRCNMDAGRALLGELENLGAHVDRLRELEELFFPERPEPPFALWIGASWTGGRELRFKAYLNPQIHGHERAPELVESAMQRLGFRKAWSSVRELLSCESERRDELGIVSLDLSSDHAARVKVYIRHHRATVNDIDRIASVAEDYDRDDVARFYSLLARSGGPFLRKPALTEMTFQKARSDRPTAVTLEFPIRCYVEHDDAARERIERCLVAFGLPTDTYRKAIQAFATRPLDERSGIHAHVTLGRVGHSANERRPRIALYLASEAYVVRGNGGTDGHGAA